MNFQNGRQNRNAKHLAPRPPMGWNSYDCYGCSVREAEVRANAEYMAQWLSDFGWQTVVVDGEWADPEILAGGCRKNAVLMIDEYGRLVPATNRFPSTAGGQGFKPLSDYVHSLGLQFGIHIMRGIPRLAVKRNLPILGPDYRAREIANPSSTCRWNTDMYGVDMEKPGGQAYYDSIVKLYAGWEVDFIKADDMVYPFHPDEIAALSRAIEKSGREILLSLSPGRSQDLQTPNPEKVAFLSQHSEMWRISDDVWDRWEDLKHQFVLFNLWSSYAGPGHWPDGDMLPLGRIGTRAPIGSDRTPRFTHDEQVLLMSLWCIARSPLMFGGDLPSLDDFTLSLLTNQEVLAVNQTATSSRQLFRNGDQVAWLAELPGDQGRALALFNLSDDKEERLRVRLADIGLAGPCTGRDLWQGKTLENVETELTCQIKAHSSRLFRISPLSNIG